MNGIHCDVLGAGEAVVLIHGWGMHSGIWMDFAEALAEYYQVICLDLPGHGLSKPLVNQTFSELSQVLLAVIPAEKFKIIGWSLGGLFALNMARVSPDRVQAVMMLASNPCFVAHDKWPGVGVHVLDNFAEQLQADPQQTLMRFMALQVNGLPDARMRLQQIKQAVLSRPAADIVSLKQGLYALKHEDLRETLEQLACPVTAVLAGRDMLVPIVLANDLQALRADMRIHVLPDAGHMPFMTHADDLLRAVLDCL